MVWVRRPAAGLMRGDYASKDDRVRAASREFTAWLKGRGLGIASDQEEEDDEDEDDEEDEEENEDEPAAPKRGRGRPKKVVARQPP